MTVGISTWVGLGLSFLPPLWFSQNRAAYFKVGIVLGDDVLRARLVLAVPHVDVQLPLLQRREEGKALRHLCRAVNPSVLSWYKHGDEDTDLVHALGMHQGG